MARGKRKSVDERVAAQQEVVSNLKKKLDAENKKLQVLIEEKKTEGFKVLTDMLNEANLSSDEAKEVLQKYIENKA